MKVSIVGIGALGGTIAVWPPTAQAFVLDTAATL